MRTKASTAALFLALLGALALTAADPWKKKSYTEWDYYDVEQVLTDSPWAVPTSVGGTSFSVGAVRARQGTVEHGVEQKISGGVVVRWFSAATVRQACARSNQLAGVAPPERAQQLLAWQPTQFVIAVGEWAVGSDPFFTPVDSDLPAPEDVFLELLSSKRKIAPVKHQMMGNTHLYSFPREENGQPLLASEQKVRFSARMQLRQPSVVLDVPSTDTASAGRSKMKRSQVSVTFDLRKMMREGQPDL